MTPEFESIFDWCGSPSNTCGCGRTHFVSSGDNMDEGEVEALHAADAAAAAAARTDMRKRCAEIVRKHYPTVPKRSQS